MKELNREKGLMYGVRQYDKACDKLVKIVRDLLPLCEVYFKDEIIYLIFEDDIDTFNITYALGINESCINHITALTDIKYHYAIPLEYIRRI